MAYDTRGLIPLMNASLNQIWQLRTVDALAGVTAAGYISDAGPTASGKGVAGRGLRLGDTVRAMTVDNVVTPTTVTAAGIYVVSAINAATGAGTIIAG
jgi:hypothetical protein